MTSSLLPSIRLLGGANDDSATANGNEEHFGVHIAYTDIYLAILFLSTVYFSGFLSSRFLSMPNLVGEIFAGIILGPNVLNIVPNVEAFVMLGEIGLILLVLEAGIDIDLTTLKLIGKRGMMIAVVGTFLPILLAFGLAGLLGYRGTAAIAAACTFAPTSLGIAMNVLKGASLVNTPVGQVVVAAAIIDDMIALIILSQLQAFSKQVPTTLDLLVPVISALAFLFVGGYIAVFVLPRAINRFILDRIPHGAGHSNREWMSLAIMFVLLLGLIPLTFYAKASPLMGAFLAGLVFCSNEGAHHMFLSQFKRVLQWLLRIFFAASIGFQVPIQKFANPTVIWQGLVFAFALLGKVAVGFMVPDFSAAGRFKGMHVRDCLVVGFSMMAEGEFAFVIAVFSVTNGMMTQELYASVVLAVLASTILAPFFLRYTISQFNKKVEETMSGNGNDIDASLAEAIRNKTAVFFCIRTKSVPSWGLFTGLMEELRKLNLQVIDHRSWHPRQSDSLLVNEIYVLDANERFSSSMEKRVFLRAEEITVALEHRIGQPQALVGVVRWMPQMPSSSARSTREHIAQATREASEANADQFNYAKMDGEKDSINQVDKLGGNYAGRLDGLFRHDSDRKIYASRRTSGEGIELQDTYV